MTAPANPPDEIGRAEAIASVRKWLKNDHLKLHAGEMTAQETRTVKAVLAAVILELAALSKARGETP